MASIRITLVVALAVAVLGLGTPARAQDDSSPPYYDYSRPASDNGAADVNPDNNPPNPDAPPGDANPDASAPPPDYADVPPYPMPAPVYYFVPRYYVPTYVYYDPYPIGYCGWGDYGYWPGCSFSFWWFGGRHHDWGHGEWDHHDGGHFAHRSDGPRRDAGSTRLASAGPRRDLGTRTQSTVRSTSIASTVRRSVSTPRVSSAKAALPISPRISTTPRSDMSKASRKQRSSE